MIPPFDPRSGNLPPGIHAATWDELVQSYGYTEHRRALLTGLRAALDALSAAGCLRVYIDGSFVTGKVDPGDYDACWELGGVNLPRLGLLAPALFDVRPRRPDMKREFKGDLFAAEATADVLGRSFLEFFQRDKETDEPKGILMIDLGNLP